jgi:hypothetical protein
LEATGRPAVTGDLYGHAGHLPLEPSNEADLEQLYLPFDRTKEEFDKFKDRVAREERLGEQGWLVVVTGDRGCGKTSLIKRCALWLDLRLRERKLSPTKIDLTGEDLEHEDIKARLRRVFMSVINHLAIGLGRETVTSMRELGHSDRDGDLNIAFESLASELLANSTVAIVLLPTCHTAREVLRYAAIARRGLIFFAEVFDPREASRCDAELRLQRYARASAPLYLEVGRLKPGDGHLFANNLNLSDSGAATTDPFPRMTEELIQTHVEEMIKDPGMSILRLRLLASGARREAARRGAQEIESVDVATYLYRFGTELM